MPTAKTSFLIKWLLPCLVLLSLLAGNSYAQTPTQLTSPANDSSQASIELPKQLSEQQVAQIMAQLSDKEVRQLLQKQLDSLVVSSDAQSEAASVLSGLKSGVIATLASFYDAGASVPRLFQRLPDTAEAFKGEDRDWQFLYSFGAILVVGLILGWLSEWLFIWLFSGLRSYIDDRSDHSLKHTLMVLTARAGRSVMLICVFYIVAEQFYEAMLEKESDNYTAEALLDLIFIARITYLICAFFLAPKRPELRLCAVSDTQAQAMTWRLVTVSLIYGLTVVFIPWSWEMGLKPGETRLGFWLNLATYSALGWVIWRSSETVQCILLSTEQSPSASRQRFAANWPKIVIGTIVWVFLLEHYLYSQPGADFEDTYAQTTLMLFMAVPLVDTGISALINHLYAIDEAHEARIVAARKATRQSLLRVARVIATCIGIFIIAKAWGLQLADLASQGLGAQFAGALVEILLLLLLAYLVWELVRTSIDYKLVLEQPEETEEVESGGEGGAAGSRLSTLLPILRSTALVAICLFTAIAVLSALKVNVAPLLAGAGVLGLAIGFGAQTLVKDIVSGVFFLIDDAFRMGEYVDTGSTKGTVEKIAVRSLRLRHHLGALHTIPYGELSQLTNYSRDWVIMKLRFQVPHDTDINKIKKLFKKLGKELLEHPELGPDFIEPFKSQGVLEVDEIGMVVRGKFMAKPGRQFMIRKEIYVRVQRLFEENGIEFAKRSVEVKIPDNSSESLKNSVAAAASEIANAKPTPPPA